MLTREELAQRLKEMRLKITPQRLEVYAALSDYDRHPTAMEIYEDVKLQMPTLSFATIYQALNCFCRIGLVRMIDVGDGIMRYDVDTRPHAHIRCETCGRIFNLDWDYKKAFDDEVADKSGFLIYRHQTYFLGLCPDCQKASPRQ